MNVAVKRRGPGSRADALHPTRHALLDAAIRIAGRQGLDGLTIEEVTREAELAKGTFYVHFTDRNAMLVDLHRRFHDELYRTIAASAAAQEPGPDRARARILGFLDGCRRQAGVRAMLLQARSEPAIARAVQERNDGSARILAQDLRGSTPVPLQTARLLVAAAAEAAMQELAAGRALPRLRKALTSLIPSR